MGHKGRVRGAGQRANYGQAWCPISVLEREAGQREVGKRGRVRGARQRAKDRQDQPKHGIERQGSRVRHAEVKCRGGVRGAGQRAE